jgi:hypothetical protein
MRTVKFTHEAEEVLDFLKKEAGHSKEEQMILNSVAQKVKILTEDEFYGDRIQKRLIPSYYKKKYSITNLFRVELPCFWRLLYSVSGNQVEIIALVVDICDHKLYDRRFGYKKR